VFLDDRNFFRRHLHPKIAARYHDSITCFKDRFQLIERLRLFQLGDDRNILFMGRNDLLRLHHIRRRAHK
jgi:hypothetical protein